MGESEKLFQQPSDPIQRPVRRSSVPDQDSTTRLIPLTKGQFAIVDAADYEWLSKRKWHAQLVEGRKYPKFYALGKGQRVNEKNPVVSMHRLILGVTDPLVEVDHIDGNSLNNSRSNLRLATRMQNSVNRSLQKNNTSGFKGVHWHGAGGGWASSIRIGNGKRKNLGIFATPQEAHAAYVDAAKIYHGEFANEG
jgi:hypothetical protein